MTEVTRRPGMRLPNEGGIVEAVRPGSIAADAGIGAGDRIIAINGHVLRDAVDYQFHAADEVLDVEAFIGGTEARLTLHKHPDEDLGIDFRDAAFDGIKTCNNACYFCFLKGNPKGMRKTLYVKDDDYRLSFFHGNFVTLTNLTEDDWQRLDDQRLSPINVSVHATDLELRRHLLGNKTAPDVIPQLRRLASMGIQAHTQIVLCPGVNDGAALDRSIAGLAALYPAVQTISIVPVGETEYAGERIARGKHAVDTGACTPDYARAIIAQVAPVQRRLREQHGATVVYLADEFYLAGGAPLPPAREYDGFAQYENGIGMTRSLIEDWRRARRRLATRPLRTGAREITFVTGTLAGSTLDRLAGEFAAATGVQARVQVVRNSFFGSRVNVAGLLVSSDLREQLRGAPLGDLCVLPRYALDYTGHRFLDDGTPDDLQRDLGVPIAFASTMSEVLQILSEPLESQQAVAAPGARTNGKSWVDWTLESPSLGGRGLAKEVRG